MCLMGMGMSMRCSYGFVGALEVMDSSSRLVFWSTMHDSACLQRGTEGRSISSFFAFAMGVLCVLSTLAFESHVYLLISILHSCAYAIFYAELRFLPFSCKDDPDVDRV